MPQKRKRRASPSEIGLPAGQPLKRNVLPNARCGSSSWSWVGSEVQEVNKILSEHTMTVYGLSYKSGNLSCKNKYVTEPTQTKNVVPSMTGELEDDIIIISDDEDNACNRKNCKKNPACLNYMGQEMWEDESVALEAFMKIANLGDNPMFDSREPDLPVGLKNLGATCYANASLQVWFRDLAFRDGVYQCQPPEGAEDRYKESPIYQLQVTFSALQESNQNVFNPTKLVESLQIRTSEQQDAQEFSKLFMSHLDSEFKKQATPTIKSLITDQFQGSQVYGTICYACQYKSERTSNFLEIEVNFEAKSTLEDRLAASLQLETLSGDNQYFCSQCNGLQDATRYTELRQLPPVLHFSLLRFVYDLSTMERKKSKHAISFPTALNMRKFLGDEKQRKQTATSSEGNDLYELRGVLLHKGTSAYHGHYEAQVYDPNLESWYQFNDEIVTKIKSLGEGISNSSAKSKGEEEVTTQAKNNRASARKRRRVDDSDDGNHSDTTTKAGAEIAHSKGGIITSKDAYMLIYARKDVKAEGLKIPVPHPPDRALEVVQALNEAHEVVCEEYDKREQAIKLKFQATRQKVMDIYRTWNLESFSSDFVVIGREPLEDWLSKDCVKSALLLTDLDRPTPYLIPNADILCIHEKLDPEKSQEMKTITKRSYNAIVRDTHCDFSPVLSASDVCLDCIATLFRERLYELEHPRLIKNFEQVEVLGDDEPGFWISKRWLRDWKLVKPKMHITSEVDPSPDSSEFEGHVKCEHGGLSPNTTNRRKISIQATNLLKDVYLSWEPISTEEETCPICDTLVHISKEEKREIRRKSEEEKAKLKHLNSIAFSFGPADSAFVSFAIIPTQFYKSWKRWVDNPNLYQRPGPVDNSDFFCCHEMLIFDPNCPTDLESLGTVIRWGDWETIHSLYSGGPLIALERRREAKDGEARYDHIIPVCSDCRLKRKTDWENAEVIVHLHSRNSGTTRKQITAYSRNPGARQSKRLRNLNEHGERRKLSITKSSTVKDIKITISETFSIPTIYQTLRYKDQELEDNELTVAELGILANDALDLYETREVVDLDSDSDAKPLHKKLREEGQGFSGTILGGITADSSRPSSRAETPVDSSPVEKQCKACTFSNAIDAVSCTICDTRFE